MNKIIDRSDWKKEHHKLIKEELSYLKKHQREQSSALTKKAEQHIPENLGSKLEYGFAKGFRLVFDKGIESFGEGIKAQKYATEHRIATKNLESDLSSSISSLENMANGVSRRGKLLSGIEGVGFGAVGIGLPDIPIFIAHLLRRIYEIAAIYGFSVEGDREKIFILRIIRAAVSRGETLIGENKKIGKMILCFDEEEADLEAEIDATAAAMSLSQMASKFVQGLFLVGVVGGLSNYTVMKDLTDYTEIIYKKRFLRKIYEEMGRAHED